MRFQFVDLVKHVLKPAPESPPCSHHTVREIRPDDEELGWAVGQFPSLSLALTHHPSAGTASKSL